MTKKRNTKTKLLGEQDIVHKFPIAKEPRRINTPRDIRVLDGYGSPGGPGSIQSKYAAPTWSTMRGCMQFFRNGLCEMNV